MRPPGFWFDCRCRMDHENADGDLSVSKLRWGIAAVSIYFAACWASFAGEDRYRVAFLVFGVGLFLGSGVLRSVERLFSAVAAVHAVRSGRLRPSLRCWRRSKRTQPSRSCPCAATRPLPWRARSRAPKPAQLGDRVFRHAARARRRRPQRRAREQRSHDPRQRRAASSAGLDRSSTSRRSRRGRFACSSSGWCPMS